MHNSEERETSLKRVALVHSFYSSRQPSGENVVVLQQAEALRKSGHEVEVFARHTDEQSARPLYKLTAAYQVATGHGAKPNFSEFNPDIVHIHNTFPNFGKSWIETTSIPIVTSLHNYRPLCAAGTLYRDGSICTECGDSKSSLPAIRHGCYRGRLQTVPVALGQRFDRDQTLLGANAILALSNQMRSIYETAGVASSKIHILPHFLPDSVDSGLSGGGDYWIYAGRLSAEKGVLGLVENWPLGRKLLIVGQGDLEERSRASSQGKDIEFLGHLDRSQLLSLIGKAKGLLFPSVWYEGFGLVYMESIALGTPVLAWHPSVVASFIENDKTGLVATGFELDEALTIADDLFPDLRQHCRRVFELNYTESAWIDGIRSVYDSLH